MRMRESLPAGDRDPLIEAALAGDQGAVGRLIDRLAAELLPFASALTSGSAEADVLVGDTLSRVHERLPAPRARSSLGVGPNDPPPAFPGSQAVGATAARGAARVRGTHGRADHLAGAHRPSSRSWRTGPTEPGARGPPLLARTNARRNRS